VGKNTRRKGRRNSSVEKKRAMKDPERPKGELKRDIISFAKERGEKRVRCPREYRKLLKGTGTCGRERKGAKGGMRVGNGVRGKAFEEGDRYS